MTTNMTTTNPPDLLSQLKPRRRGTSCRYRYVTFKKANGKLCEKLMMVADSRVNSMNSISSAHRSGCAILPCVITDPICGGDCGNVVEENCDDDDGNDGDDEEEEVKGGGGGDDGKAGYDDCISSIGENDDDGNTVDVGTGDGEGEAGVDLCGEDLCGEEDEDIEEVLSPREIARRYRLIMQQVHPLGSSVWIQYGYRGRADWYPGTVVAVIDEGKRYCVKYLNDDDGDPSVASKPAERVRSMAREDSIIEACYLSDSEDEKDMDWECATKRPCVSVNTKSLTHETMADRLGKDGKLSTFPARKCWQHLHQPHLYTGMGVVKYDRKTGSVFSGVIRQVLQDPATKSRFLYVIRSLPSVRPLFHEEVWEDRFLSDCDDGSRFATTLPASSSSSTSGDVFLLPTVYQARSRWCPLVHRYFGCLRSRSLQLHEFELRYNDPGFISKQQSLLSALWDVIVLSHGEPPRPQWKAWVAAESGSSDHVFQLLVLLLQSNSSTDSMLAESSNELWAHFPTAHSVCRDPIGFYNFLTGCGSSGCISKGYNYCFQKANNVVKLSKQLIAFAYSNLTGTALERIQNESWFKYGSLEPVPSEFLDNVPLSHRLLPVKFDSSFFSRLHGVGPKIRNLIAEAGYNEQEGPALDCHMIRYTVSVGAGPAPSVTNPEAYCGLLKRVFPRSQWQMLNEVPASIGQLLARRSHEVLKRECLLVGKRLGLQYELESFLNHYPPQHLSDYPRSKYLVR